MIVFNKIYFIFSCMNVVVSLRRNVGNRESLILYNARIFDLVVRNKESYWSVHTLCAKNPVFRIYGIRTVYTREKLGGFISFIVSWSK